MSAPTTTPVRRGELTPEHFEEAARIIRAGGLAKGSYVHLDETSQQVMHCSVGAMREAVTGSPHTHSVAVEDGLDFLAIKVLNAELQACDCGVPGVHYADGASPFGVVTRWNDQPERTAEEVAAAMERAARLMREAAS